jgi:hypothetical protein
MKEPRTAGFYQRHWYLPFVYVLLLIPLFIYESVTPMYHYTVEQSIGYVNTGNYSHSKGNVLLVEAAFCEPP